MNIERSLLKLPQRIGLSAISIPQLTEILNQCKDGGYNTKFAKHLRYTPTDSM